MSKNIMPIKGALNQLVSKYKNDRERYWWPAYLFHFSEMDNVISILESGYLYSREYCNEHSLMLNDNADLEVISKTRDDYKKYVRFYFRPKTPTQFNNEGYKKNKEHAHCPRPIFLLFKSSDIFRENNCLFSDMNVAKGQANVYYNYEEILNVDFDKVYHNSYLDIEERDEIIGKRQAEVLVKDKIKINSSLRSICCRSQAEYETFKNFLKDNDIHLYRQYKDLIVYKKYNLFYKNGFYVEKVNLGDSEVEIEYNLPNTDNSIEVKYIVNIAGNNYVLKEKGIREQKVLIGYKEKMINDIALYKQYLLKIEFDDKWIMYYGKYEGNSFII